MLFAWWNDKKNANHRPLPGSTNRTRTRGLDKDLLSSSPVNFFLSTSASSSLPLKYTMVYFIRIVVCLVLSLLLLFGLRYRFFNTHCFFRDGLLLFPWRRWKASCTTFSRRRGRRRSTSSGWSRPTTPSLCECRPWATRGRATSWAASALPTCSEEGRVSLLACSRAVGRPAPSVGREGGLSLIHI